MGRKRRSSFSSASTDDSEDDAPPDPPVKRARQSPIAGQAPRLDQPGSSASDGPYLSAEAIAARRKAMATVLNAMPEPTKLKPTVSTDSWSHHYALQRVCPEGMKPLRDDTPTNTTFPDTLSYPPKPDGTARIVFWNINGVLTSGRKFTSDYKKSINAEYGETVQKSISKPTALQRYVEAEDPDFVCLAETKLSKDVTTAEAENQLPLLKQRFPVCAMDGHVDIADSNVVSILGALNRNRLCGRSDLCKVQANQQYDRAARRAGGGAPGGSPGHARVPEVLSVDGLCAALRHTS